MIAPPLRRGFTLIEILATLGIMAIGLASVIALVLGSSRMSVGAVDKNTAALIVSEAVEDITRIHQVTKEQLTLVGLSPARDGDIGLYVETLDTAPGTVNPATLSEWPNLQTGAYSQAGIVRVSSDDLIRYKNPASFNTLIWPPRPTPKYYGGPLQAGGTPSGSAFRAMYRLERHPDWVIALATSVPTAYEGIYVLTLVVYKDLQPNDPVNNPGHKYEQVTDPVVVYLRKKG